MKRSLIIFAAIAAMALSAHADVIRAGAGSYTDAFPGTDKAGRNGYPTATPLVSGPAASRPVPSNDWWSSKLTQPSPQNMFNYPLGIKTNADGLVMLKCIEGQSLPAENPITIGLEGLQAPSPSVYDYSDWTVTFAWDAADGRMLATAGIGMPFVYFQRQGSRDVRVNVAVGSIAIEGNIAVVSGSYNGASYALYAPSGCTWTRSGNTLSASLAGKDYWSVAMLPDGADAAATARRWAKCAFAFPADTRAEWLYNAASGQVGTSYTVTVDAKEAGAVMLQGLLPHHTAHLAGSPAFTGDTYKTVRGTLKMMEGNTFSTSLTFHGVLSTLPVLGDPAHNYDRDELSRLIQNVIDDNGLNDWTDSYNDGQLFNRLVQTARIAKEAGLTAQYESIRNTVRNHLERWFTYTPGDVAFLFYYYQPWGALLGYPAGHGQDNNLNDHHFHWGYLIHAAAFLAADDPQWADQWGPMIDLLIRDAASTDRNDPLFPYQRAFSPFAGHCWANGTATSGPGNDQESSSEAMQFHCSLIHWGEATGNTAIRDLGIYMYATEQSAIRQYWFDVDHTNFDPNYGQIIASRVFTNAYDIQNFWGGGIQGSYGIELYPIHAGSLYLADDPEWQAAFRAAIERDTPLLLNNNDPNTWHDVYWQYFALSNAPYALQLYENHPSRTLKFGISAAQTYQWIHSLVALGRPSRSLTATHPLATAFDLGDVRTYAVQNYSDSPLSVTYSDGFTLTAPPHTLYTTTGVNPDPWMPGDDDDPGQGGGDDNPGGDNPGGDNPGGDNPASGSCTVTGTEASEGEFIAPYTVTFATVGNRVDVRVTFDGSYVGPVAYIFNETDGFTEIPMTLESGQTFIGSISGVSEDRTLKVRIKLAYAAGGLAVTRQMTYTVGDDCGTSGILPTAEYLGPCDVKVAGHIISVQTGCPGVTANLINTAGIVVKTVSGDSSLSIDASSLPSGVYILRLDTPCGPTVRLLRL